MARIAARVARPGWDHRSQVDRVGLYTRVSLYAVYWFVVGLTATGVAGGSADVVDRVGVLVATLALGAASMLTLRSAIRLFPDSAPLPLLELAALVAVAGAAEALVLTLPERARFAAALVVVGSVTWGAGGLRDRRVQVFLVLASPLAVLAATRSLPLAACGVALGLFVVFTVQSSLWLLGVVTELDEARGSQAALAVAEERLRFSRDVHDVLGRRLSTIAVQAELAATLAARGEPGVGRILEVRDTAHDALREARQLARGYRPLELAHEVEGAIALLRSAGVTATSDLGDLPEPWHEPVARTIRECVTNVLRHSRATRVTMTYADGEVVIRNDGVRGAAEAVGGTGLQSLEEQLAVLGAHVVARRAGDEFVVRVLLAGAPVGSVPR